MQTPQVSPEQFLEHLKATEELHDSIREYLDGWISKGCPIAGSQLERECREFGDTEAIVSAYYHGAILNDLVGNQLIALTRALTPPYLGLASWTILRMLLESAALSSWLLDPACTAKDRVNRSYSWTWLGLTEQKKFVASRKSPQISDAESKLATLEADAKAHNIVVGRNKKRETVVGIGQDGHNFFGPVGTSSPVAV